MKLWLDDIRKAPEGSDGGDGIKLILWLIETEKFYPIRLHTMNPVGKQNMQALINRYWP